MFQAIVGIGALAHDAAPRVDDDGANVRIRGRLTRARTRQINRAAQELLVGDVIRQVCKKNKMTMETQSYGEITWKTFSPFLCASVPPWCRIFIRTANPQILSGRKAADRPPSRPHRQTGQAVPTRAIWRPPRRPSQCHRAW